MINLCDGDIIDAYYITIGSYSSEVSYTLTAPNGTTLFSGGGTSVNMNLFNGNASCSTPGIIDCNGGDFILVAQGVGGTSVILDNDFDAGGMGSGWNTNVSADFSNPCDPSLDGGTYMWMGNSAQHPREIETLPMDLSCGAEICFLLDFATQGLASPCEGIDLANEGVYLEYSIDGGNTWITIEYYGPAGPGNNTQGGGQNPQMTSWNQYCHTIQPGVMSASTIIHWAQTGSSGINNDHWGIDNVVVSGLDCDPYLYDWTMVPGNDNDSLQIINLSADSTFTVWYGNTSDSCSAQITIIIPPSPDANAGIDQTICSGNNSVIIGGNPITASDSSSYSWSTGDTGTVILTGINQDLGQISVSPSVTTEYYLEVTKKGCTSYATVLISVD